MNKYRKFARRMAQTICDMMNLFYKKEAAGQFLEELLLSLDDIVFKDKENKWTFRERKRNDI